MFNVLKANHFLLCSLKLLLAITLGSLSGLNWKTGHACHQRNRSLDCNMYCNFGSICCPYQNQEEQCVAETRQRGDQPCPTIHVIDLNMSLTGIDI